MDIMVYTPRKRKYINYQIAVCRNEKPQFLQKTYKNGPRNCKWLYTCGAIYPRNLFTTVRTCAFEDGKETENM